MEKLLEVLREVRDDIDFENCKTLIDDSVLDSFDILQIISELNDAYDIEISAAEVVPENFNSADNLLAMVNRLKG